MMKQDKKILQKITRGLFMKDTILSILKLSTPLYIKLFMLLEWTIAFFLYLPFFPYQYFIFVKPQILQNLQLYTDELYNFLRFYYLIFIVIMLIMVCYASIKTTASSKMTALLSNILTIWFDFGLKLLPIYHILFRLNVIKEFPIFIESNTNNIFIFFSFSGSLIFHTFALIAFFSTFIDFNDV